MSNKKQELKNNLEDAYIALIMDDFSEEEGARLLEECTRLNADPNAAVPESIHTKCMEVIDNHFAQERNAQVRLRIKSRAKKAVLVAAIIAALFTTAFATIEEFRVGVLNFALDIQEKYSNIIFNKSEDKNNLHSMNNASVLCDRRLIIYYDFSEFELTKEIYDEIGLVVSFATEEQGQTVKILVSNIEDNMSSRVDTEDADNIKDVLIRGMDGKLIIKDSRCHVLWINPEGTKFMQVITTGMTAEQALKIAECIVYSENR